MAGGTQQDSNTTSGKADRSLPRRPAGLGGASRQKIVDRLFSVMLSARLSELTQKPDPPFTLAFGGRGSFIGRTKDSATFTALVKEDGVERGLDALLTEAERVARFGFTATELERQRQAALRNYERLALEKENRQAGSRADEYVRNFLQDETLPSVDDEYALHKRFLPEISLDEINKLAREWFPDSNRTVVVRAPEKSGLLIPDQTKLAAVIKNAAAKDLRSEERRVGKA